MADGNWTHTGACAVSLAQFPLGLSRSYNIDGSYRYSGEVEDSYSIEYVTPSSAMPGNTAGTITWACAPTARPGNNIGVIRPPGSLFPMLS